MIFAEDALQEYFYWQIQDKKNLKRINQLIQEIQRNGFMSGIGKPKTPKDRKIFSRRIDDKNRLVYIADDKGDLIILSCIGHYED